MIIFRIFSNFNFKIFILYGVFKKRVNALSYRFPFFPIVNTFILRYLNKMKDSFLILQSQN